MYLTLLMRCIHKKIILNHRLLFYQPMLMLLQVLDVLWQCC